jgi:hypothetical protein
MPVNGNATLLIRQGLGDSVSATGHLFGSRLVQLSGLHLSRVSTAGNECMHAGLAKCAHTFSVSNCYRCVTCAHVVCNSCLASNIISTGITSHQFHPPSKGLLGTAANLKPGTGTIDVQLQWRSQRCRVNRPEWRNARIDCETSIVYMALWHGNSTAMGSCTLHVCGFSHALQPSHGSDLTRGHVLGA